jgi:hypothetical protein
MWLMTKHGFYSIVLKEPVRFHVRARERQDLQNLIDRVPLPGVEIIDTPDGDYAARLVVDGAVVLKILEFLGNTLDYSNFKNQIAKTPDQSHKPYHEVWGVMASALGAYGKIGLIRWRDVTGSGM